MMLFIWLSFSSFCLCRHSSLSSKRDLYSISSCCICCSWASSRCSYSSNRQLDTRRRSFSLDISCSYYRRKWHEKQSGKQLKAAWKHLRPAAYRGVIFVITVTLFVFLVKVNARQWCFFYEASYVQLVFMVYQTSQYGRLLHTFSTCLPSSSFSSYWLLFNTHAAVLSTGDMVTDSTGDCTCFVCTNVRTMT